MFNFENHFKERHLDPTRYHMSWDNEVPEASFHLYNLSGQLVGYHKYRPLASKERNNVEGESRYYTYFTGESKRKMIGLFGIETLYFRMPVVFLTEGVFDVVRAHNLGLPGLAVFSNNPKHLNAFFTCFPCKKVVLCDNDAAGRKLAKFGNEAVFAPEGKDFGDLTDDEVKELLKDYL